MYIAVSLLVLLLSTLLYKRAAGYLSPLKPNVIVVVFYYGVLLTTFIGAVAAVSGFNDHYMLRGASERSIFIGWLFVLYSLIAVPCGMLLVNIATNTKPMRSIINSYCSSSLCEYRYAKAEEQVLFPLVAVSVAACFYVFYHIGYIPVLKVMIIDSNLMAETRVRVTREFSGVVYIRNLLAMGLTPLLSYICFLYLHTPAPFLKRVFRRLVFLLVLVCSINILYYNFEKSPVLWYLIGFYFIRFYLGEKIRILHAFLLFAIVLLVIVLFYSIGGIELQGLLQYNKGPVGRLVFSQIAGLFHYIDIYPSVQEYVGISSLSKLVTVFGIEYSDSAGRIAMSYFNPDGYRAGTVNVLSTYFMGEAWANFGWPGVIFAPFWVGIFIQSLHVSFLKLRKTPLYLGLFVYLSLSVKLTSGFNVFIYNSALMFLVILFAGIVLSARSLLNSFERWKVERY